MTLRWIEGVEGNEHATHIERKYRAVTGSLSIGLNQGRSPLTNCLRDNSGTGATPSLSDTSPEHDTWVIGFAFKVDDSSSAGTPTDTQITGIECISNTDVSPAAQVSLQLVRDDEFIYHWVLKRGNQISSTLIATSSKFWANKWYYFELKVKVDPSAGTYELRQDGVDIMSGSGANTAAAGDAGMDSVKFHLDGDIENGGVFYYFDDIYILDTLGSYNNDFLGDCLVDAIYPNAIGDVQQWDPSAAVDHHTLVDETTGVDDDTKVTSDTTDEVELFGYETPARVVDNIRGVMIYTTHAMQSSGSRTFVHAMRDISNNDNLGPTTFTSSSGVWDMAPEIIEKEPQGAADWTLSDLTDYQFGMKVTG
jgi:hypothetical protein